jgi:hypothetical protein
MMRTLAVLAALAALAPAAAGAQGCIGVPLPEGGRALQLVAGAAAYDIGDPEDVDGTELGADYRANPGGPLAYAVGYSRRGLGDADEGLHVGMAEVTFRAPLPPTLPVAVCARAGVAGARFAQAGSGTEYTNYTVPLGVVVEMPLAGGAFAPYVSPLFLYSTTSGETFEEELGGSGSGFGVEAGAGVRFGRAVVGGGYVTSDLGTNLATPAFARQRFFVRAGIVF